MSLNLFATFLSPGWSFAFPTGVVSLFRGHIPLRAVTLFTVSLVLALWQKRLPEMVSMLWARSFSSSLSLPCTGIPASPLALLPDSVIVLPSRMFRTLAKGRLQALRRRLSLPPRTSLPPIHPKFHRPSIPTSNLHIPTTSTPTLPSRPTQIFRYTRPRRFNRSSQSEWIQCRSFRCWRSHRTSKRFSCRCSPNGIGLGFPCRGSTAQSCFIYYFFLNGGKAEWG